VSSHRLVAQPRVALDVTAAFEWYENEENEHTPCFFVALE